MFNFVLSEINEVDLSKINYIFREYKNIKLNIIDNKTLINNKLLDHYIFFNKNLCCPINNFIEELQLIFNNFNINFCYLSECKNIYFVRSSNINIITEPSIVIDIKRENNINILFFNNYNSIDHIVIPEYINNEYIFLLNNSNNYNNIINNNISYKTYNDFLKYYIKNNICYNIIIFIYNINHIKYLEEIKLPKYNYYRISIFHNINNIDDIILINSICKNISNKINLYYLSNYWFSFFTINNNKLLWFEKIILVNNLDYFPDDNILEKLNYYHNNNYNNNNNISNVLLDNIISIDASDFVCIPFFNIKDIHLDKSNTSNHIFNLVKNYIYNNKYNYNILEKKYTKNNIKFIINNNKNYIQNQLLLVKNYELIINYINDEIKNNYNADEVIRLLIKKVSLSVLCKNEEVILNDINIIISSINDVSYLSSLILLFKNISNKKILNKLYIKILNLSNENILSHLSILCFKSLLSNNMTEEELNTVFDFININSSKDIINKEEIKKICVYLFYSISKFITNNELLNKFNIIIRDLFDINDIKNIDEILLVNTDNKLALIHLLIFISTNFSAYYKTFEEFIIKRNDIKNNLEYLLKKDLPICSLDNVVILPVTNFYLSYQGIPSKDIFILKNKIIRKICPELNYKIKQFPKFNNNNKINICFHSNFLSRRHSVYKDRHQIINKLSYNNDFNVYFTTFDDLNDDVKYTFGQAKHIKISNKLSSIKAELEKLNLHILIYCEIAMCPNSYFMAFMKLANIQINTWGHSDTSGIDTIDYFISSKLYELDTAQNHYSEQLIKHNSLCTSYNNPLSKYNINSFKNRFEYGFTDEVIIYFCGQSLFKFNPVFDQYIIDILTANTNFILIILDSLNKIDIINRFNNKNITSRIHTYNGMSHFNFLNLIYISDIMLDTFPFGACNTSFEAFSLNKIIITQQSNMINGRFTSGFYKKMNLSEMITNSKEEYINLAIKLGNNKEFRNNCEEKIINNKNCLFNDEESINEWTETLYNL